MNIKSIQKTRKGVLGGGIALYIKRSIESHKLDNVQSVNSSMESRGTNTRFWLIPIKPLYDVASGYPKNCLVLQNSVLPLTHQRRPAQSHNYVKKLHWWVQREGLLCSFGLAMELLPQGSPSGHIFISCYQALKTKIFKLAFYPPFGLIFVVLLVCFSCLCWFVIYVLFLSDFCHGIVFLNFCSELSWMQFLLWKFGYKCDRNN